MRNVYPNLFMAERSKASDTLKGAALLGCIILFIGILFVAGTRESLFIYENNISCMEHPTLGKICR